ncbi:bifunctional phosphoribosylaminoimidazolecarboxamide formyltransferase/IMP cyclohydrolase [Bowdeniella massiliensis]|uniref:bifunctional phosphoribosylaminoimidazolecarboxamide formyltransferase/IMP cyclohydrolase n=1 Tax=Bowdeniella massiliensis TaxID=2932264 RepID=UPI0020285320|nr:bifunctional phosphoribosylaminoimidazolecarboxamide formyltransferase/IMP cyclohydrolase [Bowdeniella massiliensis]
MTRRPIARALVSVFDKTGIAELARALGTAGVEIVSTGSTAATIAEAGVAVTPVEELTGFPECLDGRVKTLHPAVHAGILADRSNPDHVAQLADLEVAGIDLVVVNLYPFAATVASGASVAECIEKIDIGGPTMVRAAAKNHGSVAVVTDPARYGEVAAALAAGGFTDEERRALALDAFRHTATYDVAVATWLAQLGGQDELPEWLGRTWDKAADLRYGENPHQRAALYVSGEGLASAEQLGGKAMSYNNYVDADAAWRAAWDQGDQPTCAIIKHTNPCGLAVGQTIAEAHAAAHSCDPMSAFGGIIAVNREVDAELAAQIVPIFTEVVLAPSYSEQARDILGAKKNLRLLKVAPPERSGVEIRPISGGLLAQEVDTIDAVGRRDDGRGFGDDSEHWNLVAGEAADAHTLADLQFAWRAVRAVKSNAVLLARDGATVGVGMGQVNRVDSAKLAVERANTLGVTVASEVDSAGGAEGVDSSGAPERARGAVAASDAFFPFPDGLQVLIDAGVRAVVAPGGSVRDADVIAAAKDAGLTMYFTGVRHFFH